MDLRSLDPDKMRLGDALPLLALQRAIGERWSVIPPDERPSNLSDFFPLPLNRSAVEWCLLDAIRANIMALAPMFINHDLAENAADNWREPKFYDVPYILKMDAAVLKLPHHGAGWGVPEEKTYIDFLRSAAYWLSQFRYRVAPAWINGTYSDSLSISGDGAPSGDAAIALAERPGEIDSQKAGWLEGSYQVSFRCGGSAGKSFVLNTGSTGAAKDDYFVRSDSFSAYREIEMPGTVWIFNDAGYVAEACLFWYSGLPSWNYHDPSRAGGQPVKEVEIYDGKGRQSVWCSSIQDYLIEPISSEGATHEETGLIAGIWFPLEQWQYGRGDTTYIKRKWKRTPDGLEFRMWTEPDTVTGNEWTGDDGERIYSKAIHRARWFDKFGADESTRIDSVGAVDPHGVQSITFCHEDSDKQNTVVWDKTPDCDPLVELGREYALLPDPDFGHFPVDNGEWDDWFDEAVHWYVNAGTSGVSIETTSSSMKFVPVVDYGDVYRVSEGEELENWAGLDEGEWDRLHPSEAGSEGEAE